MDGHAIPTIANTMYYISDFITSEEETYILEKIPSNRWIHLMHRRLQALPTTLTANNTLLASSLPAWLTDPILPRFNRLGLFSDAPHGVNHCLINEYLPAQGIMAHEDGAAYHPVVATVSLGGTVVLDIIEKNGQGKWRVVQEPKSLLVTTGNAYTDTLHGIAEVHVDEELNADTVANWDLLGSAETLVATGGRNERTTRISLTFRDVQKVSRIGNKLFGKGRS
ncbi:hypothetical protein DOTSEDRAFT_118591 [Dothistroma septosporum NZE10]|uniref:Fe2OG dioxygenase domain-containing protein n=1 Tax=Dothistroma septosporum (strain NZE10 / CBS 128990) TaxID=675120 RepID=N1Q1Y9_DOTSN|nr:hypothetical protein DOTSEDRAFT_118591 [Dothistroma septosporum NZE10]